MLDMGMVEMDRPVGSGLPTGRDLQGSLPRIGFSVAHQQDMVLRCFRQEQNNLDNEEPTVLENTLPRLMAFQRLHREWRSHLTVAERDFLGWFLDNTVCWGRKTLRVTVKQMAEGTHWLRSCCIPERSLWRVISALKDKGVIVVRAAGRVTEFVINLTWKPEDETMLRIPKRLQQDQSRDEGRSTADTDDEFDTAAPAISAEKPARLADEVCQIGSPYIEDVRKEDAKNSAAAQRGDFQPRAASPSQLPLVRQRVRLAATTSTQAAIDAALEKTAARRADKAKPLTTLTVWRHAWEAAYPGSVVKALGPREMGMLSTLRKRIERGSLDWNDFLHWTVAEWRTVVAEKFEWMTRAAPPDFPEVGFLVRFVDPFLDAYARRQEREAIKAAPPEIAEYRKLRATGMRHDDALIEIGKRRAASSDREELDKEREHVARMYRVIEAERKKMDRMAAQRPSATKTDKPVIKHGDNPFEQDRPEVLDFSKLNLKWED